MTAVRRFTLRSALTLAVACAAVLTATGPAHAAAPVAADAPLYMYSLGGQLIVASGFAAPVAPSRGAVTLGPSQSTGFSWRVEYAGQLRYRLTTTTFRYDEHGNETMTKVCMGVRGTVQHGAALDYRPCDPFSLTSDQLWRPVQVSGGTTQYPKWRFRHGTAGLVAGVRGGAAVPGSHLELQRDTAEAHQTFTRSAFTG